MTWTLEHLAAAEGQVYELRHTKDEGRYELHIKRGGVTIDIIEAGFDGVLFFLLTAIRQRDDDIEEYHEHTKVQS